MAEEETKAPGVGSVIIQTPYEVEQVKLESNRLNRISIARWAWLQSLAIPETLEAVNLQALSYLFGSAFMASLIRELIFVEWRIAMVILLFVAIGSVVARFWWKRYPEFRPYLSYRLLLSLLGVCLAFFPEIRDLAIAILNDL